MQTVSPIIYKKLRFNWSNLLFSLKVPHLTNTQGWVSSIWGAFE